MSDSVRKQSFLHGTALLAGATAIVKIIGALYKIPLNAIIGPEGFGYFNTAYEIYNVLLMISTAGLPVAMSRMISQASSLGHTNQVRRIYSTARAIFLTLGLLSSLLMTLFCRQLAAFQQQPNAWAAIGFLGPCCFLICLMSTYRGFFQGQGNMLPTSVSQVLEAVCKLLVGMVAAIVLLRLTAQIPLAAGGAILGVTVSCVISSIYLFICFHKAYAQMPLSTEPVASFGATAKGLLSIAVPITLGSAGLSILTMLETKIYMGRLLLMVDQASADTMKGIYDMAKTIFNMPCAFIVPITISIIPAITSHLTLKNSRGARITAESAARITGLICMPCAVGLLVLAKPVTALLGGYSGESLELATVLMAVLGVCIIFNSIVLLTNAIMQAHGHVNLPVVNMLIGGILKLAAVFILTGNPNIGIIGTPIGSLLCYIAITVLNLITMKRCIPNSPSIVKNLSRSAAAAAIMGVFTYGAYYLLERVDHLPGSHVLLCGLPIAIGVVVYAVTAIKLKAITHSDCLLLPKGDKLAKILKL